MTDTTLVKHPNVMQLMLDLSRAGAIDEVSLTLTDPEMKFEEWEAVGRFLGSIDRACRWWVGDWLNFGEALYGEEASQAVESTPAERYDEAERVTGLDRQTLMNVSSICRRVARSRRRTELGFWIHGEVAALEPEEQALWLDKAVGEGWHRSELRSAIRAAKNPTTNDDEAHNGAGPGGSPLKPWERLEAAARNVWTQGQPTSDGSVLVPAEAWAQLRAALGEE